MKLEITINQYPDRGITADLSIPEAAFLYLADPKDRALFDECMSDKATISDRLLGLELLVRRYESATKLLSKPHEI